MEKIECFYLQHNSRYRDKPISNEWLPGFIVGHTAGEIDEDFERVRVETGEGLELLWGAHPDCVIVNSRRKET